MFRAVYITLLLLLFSLQVEAGFSCKNVFTVKKVVSTEEAFIIKLKADFTTAFQKAKVGINLPYKEWQSGRDLEEFKAPKSIDEMAYFDPVKNKWISLDAKIAVRGKSSLNDVNFPKLKIKIKADELKGTPFENMTYTNSSGDKVAKLKVGTHMGYASNEKGQLLTQPGEGRKGLPAKLIRLQNELAPYREVFPYKVLEALGVEAPRAKRAVIQYEDLGWSNRETRYMPEAKVEQKAFLFEHKSVMAERAGLKFIASESSTAKLSRIQTLIGSHYFEKIDAAQVAMVMYANALFGNWDFRVPLYEHNPNRYNSEDRIHNIYIFEKPNGRWIATPYDFDLASIVTTTLIKPRFKSNISSSELNERNIMSVRLDWINEQVQAHPKLTQSEKDKIISEIHDRFWSVKEELYRLSESLEIDPEGVANIKRHLDAFYSLI